MSNKKKYMMVMGLALGLPSTILGISLFVYYLMEQKIISHTVGLIIIVLVVVNIFYLMIRSVSKRKSED
jgi:small-conductance mechanosensitive channel